MDPAAFVKLNQGDVVFRTGDAGQEMQLTTPPGEEQG